MLERIFVTISLLVLLSLGTKSQEFCGLDGDCMLIQFCVQGMCETDPLGVFLLLVILLFCICLIVCCCVLCLQIYYTRSYGHLRTRTGPTGMAINQIDSPMVIVPINQYDQPGHSRTNTNNVEMPPPCSAMTLSM